MRKRKVATALAAGAIGMFAFASPALAHVSINPSEAEQGGFTKIALRVPNETDGADTIKIDVKLPSDHPIGSVSVKPHGGGWTAQVMRSPLATPITTDDGTVTDYISEIVWSGGKIAPGEFDEFELSLGPLPDDASSLAFPTIQSYSDGTEVAWIDEAPAGGGEAEHPVPTLALIPGGGDEHSTDSSSSTESSSSSASSSSSSSSPTVTGTAAPASTSKDDDSNGLAIAALVVGGLGLVIGIVALLTARRRPADTP